VESGPELYRPPASAPPVQSALEEALPEDPERPRSAAIAASGGIRCPCPPCAGALLKSSHSRSAVSGDVQKLTEDRHPLSFTTSDPAHGYHFKPISRSSTCRFRIALPKSAFPIKESLLLLHLFMLRTPIYSYARSKIENRTL